MIIYMTSARKHKMSAGHFAIAVSRPMCIWKVGNIIFLQHHFLQHLKHRSETLDPSRLPWKYAQVQPRKVWCEGVRMQRGDLQRCQWWAWQCWTVLPLLPALNHCVHFLNKSADKQNLFCHRWTIALVFHISVVKVLHLFFAIITSSFLWPPHPVNSLVSRFGQTFLWKFPGQWAILQLLCSQIRRTLQEELPQKLSTKPWDRAIDSLCTLLDVAC